MCAKGFLMDTYVTHTLNSYTCAEKTKSTGTVSSNLLNKGRSQLRSGKKHMASEPRKNVTAPEPWSSDQPMYFLPVLLHFYKNVHFIFCYKKFHQPLLSMDETRDPIWKRSEYTHKQYWVNKKQPKFFQTRCCKKYKNSKVHSRHEHFFCIQRAFTDHAIHVKMLDSDRKYHFSKLTQ